MGHTTSPVLDADEQKVPSDLPPRLNIIDARSSGIISFMVWKDVNEVVTEIKTCAFIA